jgi:hypothetical protein
MSETKPAEGRMTDEQRDWWDMTVDFARRCVDDESILPVERIRDGAILAADAELTAPRERAEQAEQRATEWMAEAKRRTDVREAAEQRAQEAQRERDEWKERAALEAKRHLHHSQEHDTETWNTQKVLRETKADLATARAQVGVLAGALDDICKKAVMITRRPSPDSTATAEIACCVPFAALQAARSALTTSAAEAGERWRLSESALAMLAPIRHNLLIRTVADTVREWLIEHDAELAALDAAKGAGE